MAYIRIFGAFCPTTPNWPNTDQPTQLARMTRVLKLISSQLYVFNGRSSIAAAPPQARAPGPSICARRPAEAHQGRNNLFSVASANRRRRQTPPARSCPREESARAKCPPRLRLPCPCGAWLEPRPGVLSAGQQPELVVSSTGGRDSRPLGPVGSVGRGK